MWTTAQKRVLIDCLADSPTALICNAYALIGSHSPCTNWSLKNLTPEFPAMIGEAITIKLDCSSPDSPHDNAGSDLWNKMVEQIEASELPSVVVIESIGLYENGAVLGDGMAKTMLVAGAAGCVTNGAVRDLADVKKAGLKTFAGGCVVNHTSLRWSGLGEPVKIAGLTIKTGDLLHGDGDGLIILPENGWDRVVLACRLQLSYEKAAHVVLRRTDLAVSERDRLIKGLFKKYRDMLTTETDDY